ncbi:MAG: hypothetical protein NTU98_15430 [Bacteroidetes bacterium]|nr:hypothetical protein [Bacteroidota bacterium]
MKTNITILKALLLLLLVGGSMMTMAQGPYPNTGNQAVCVNTTQPYGVVNTAGSTYEWRVDGLLVSPNWTINSNGTNLTTITWNTAAVYTVSVTETTSGGCIGTPQTIQVTVNPLNTITLSSAAGTDNQTVCINTAITNITYNTTGATGASFAGLPAGVTGAWAANVVTISGTPSASGPFNYTITLTGGCGNVTINGTITVTPDNTILLSSAAGTDNQSVCVNTAITNITYTTTGATGASFSGLPAGVTGAWAANVVTISGTPSASGPFNYTVTLTGGCGNITINGTITVTPANTITLSSAAGTNNQTVCINIPITNITYATTGATGASFAGLPAGVTGSWLANVVTISGTPSASGPFNYTVTLTGGCGNVTANGTITVSPSPSTSVIYHN